MKWIDNVFTIGLVITYNDLEATVVDLDVDNIYIKCGDEKIIFTRDEIYNLLKKKQIKFI